tara:strand:+ start:66 stop:551 length:486 start_codon:yes stop_codon:yes gene_type:complete
MEEIIYILSFLLLLVGLIGSFVPVIPGPLISFIGIILTFSFTSLPIGSNMMWILGILMAIAMVGDYVVQIFGVKKLGGGKQAIRGTLIGSLLGMSVPPIGIVFGALIGAFIGAKMELGSNRQSIKVALGAFIGFLIGTGIKLIYSGYVLYYFTARLFNVYF